MWPPLRLPVTSPTFFMPAMKWSGWVKCPSAFACGRYSLLDLLAHRVGAAVGGVGRMVPVDAAEGRAHGRGLERPVASGDLALHAAGGGEHGVAGRIDIGLGLM